MVKQIGPEELKDLLDSQELLLLDVRETYEVDHCRIEGSTNLPLGQIREAEQKFDKKTPIVVHCHHGPRSMMAAQVLMSLGFEDVTNLEGGIEGWSVSVDPSVPRY